MLWRSTVTGRLRLANAQLVGINASTSCGFIFAPALAATVAVNAESCADCIAPRSHSHPNGSTWKKACQNAITRGCDSCSHLSGSSIPRAKQTLPASLSLWLNRSFPPTPESLYPRSHCVSGIRCTALRQPCCPGSSIAAIRFRRNTPGRRRLQLMPYKASLP